MIIILSYRQDPDPALTKHMAALVEIYNEEVRICTTFAEAEAIVCNGRISGKQDRPAQESVTRVVVHNYPAPAGSGEPTPMTAVRRFNECWGTRGKDRVLQAELFPEHVFTRSNRDSDRARPRHTAISLI